MDKAVIYIHGKGGNAEEAIHYKPLFSNCDVIGLDYTAQFPWEAKEEFPLLFNSIYRNYKTCLLYTSIRRCTDFDAELYDGTFFRTNFFIRV